jgi:DNA repair protein RecO (recombination protein O)
MAEPAETMNEIVQGLILKQIDFKDYDAIITVLTKEYGKISFRAAGVRRLASKNAGSILPYTLAEIQFDYKPDQTMFRMKTARTRELYRHLHEDLAGSYGAAVAANVADAFSLPGEDFAEKDDVFAFTKKCFEYLNAGKEPKTVLCLYLADMMNLFGIQPEVDGCVRCGSTKVNALSAEDGGFLCAQHAKEAGIPCSTAEELKRFRLIVKAGLGRLDVVEKAGGADNLDLRVLEQMIRTHGAMDMKSFSLYNRLFGIE